MTDREIVEYLDESLLEHYDVSANEGGITCTCGVLRSPLELYCKSYPTPTLEWMLEKVINMKFNNKGYAVELYKPDIQDGDILASIVPQGSYACEVLHLSKDDIVTYAATPTLALRGAVEKMMESEEKV